MKIFTTYSVRIKNYNHILAETVDRYRMAVEFYIDVILRERNAFDSLPHANDCIRAAERLTVATKRRPLVKYRFADRFYKFPSYFRRAAIMEAYGKVCSYHSAKKRWEQTVPSERGKKPGLPKAGYVYPAMYRDNCFVRTGTYTARIKVWIRNTWDWLDVELKKGDVDYILHKCGDRKECVPTLQRRGKEWFLDFGFEENVILGNVDIEDSVAVAVDLGINNAATCSVLTADGTVIGREFLSLPKEKDCLSHSVNRIKKAQRHGNRKMPRLWAATRGINDRIAVLTAQFIMDVAQKYHADVIVFEHLDTGGKKTGSKKQRLHLWRAQYVQAMVADKAHRQGMHVSHVCAWGTSRLAYDGSGRVERGTDAGLLSYSICKFQTGKVYNCDLNASYNIGARYFIREIERSMPETAWLGVRAKVPGLSRRSTCTLSSLINLHAALYA